MTPSNRDAYARLIVLRGVVFQALSTSLPFVSELSAKWSENERMEFEKRSRDEAQAIVQDMKDLGAWKAASPKELKFLETYGLDVDRQQCLDAFWRKECAGILTWALGLRETWPNVDIETAPEILKTIPGQKIGLFSNLPSLRDRAEIGARRDLMEAWHWRVRTRRLIEEGYPFPENESIMKELGFHSFDDIVRSSAKVHHQDGDLPEIIDEDYVFRGKAFRSLTADEFQLATSIISERHFALNWLCGKAPGDRWDETPTET
ncbi:MAG: DUF4272 domain-containing protein [Chloroflexi bacterium]|nr:DUF4272 domain-containing protein [Chloroflexota bacterium]